MRGEIEPPKWLFTPQFCFNIQDNVVAAFELNELHLQCKKNPIRKKNKRDLEKPNKDSDNGHLKSE